MTEILQTLILVTLFFVNITILIYPTTSFADDNENKTTVGAPKDETTDTTSEEGDIK